MIMKISIPKDHQSKYEITNVFDEYDKWSCSCWMPIHHDDYYLDKNGCYTITPVWVDQEATLVHRRSGKIVATQLEPHEQITFRAYTQHCLVPPNIAEQCVKHQSFQAARRFFKKIESSNPTMLPTVAVWEFNQ